MTAEQLRNSILQEAISGRLVPQDPNDEPASVFLQRIREEKARLVKEGKLKKKDLVETPITAEEIPFEIPASWEWCRIHEISQSYIGLTYSPADVSEDGIIVLRSSNIKSGKLTLNDIVRVKKEINEKLQVALNDIIICARNGSRKLVGKSALITEMSEPMTFGAFMAICKTPFYSFVYQFLQSNLFFSQLRKVSDTTTINQLTQNNFNSFLIPLPPLAEQKRIVAKLEELLPIVEQYGKAQKELDELNAALPARLKQSILRAAFDGSLTHSNVNLWEHQKLIEFCNVYQPATISTKELVENGEYDVYGANGKIGKYTRYNHEESEVLLTCRGATCGSVNISTPKSWINGNAMVVHPKNNDLSKDFLSYMLRSLDYSNVISGGAQPQITRKSLAPIVISYPPLAEQERIVAKIEELFVEIDKLSK